MAKKQETNDYSELESPQDFNPFDEQVVQREYTKPNVSFDPNSVTHIPEPVFQRPNLDELQEEEMADDDEGDKGKTPPKSSRSRVSSDVDTSNPFKGEKVKSTRSEAANLADMSIGVYRAAHLFAAKKLTFSEAEMVQKAVKGEWNLDVQIPVSQTVFISVQDYVNQYNDDINKVLVVDEDFVKEVRPLLIEVLQEQGLGMTPMQSLLLAVSKDVGTKGIEIYRTRKQFTQSLILMTEMYNKQMGGNFNPTANNGPVKTTQTPSAKPTETKREPPPEAVRPTPRMSVVTPSEDVISNEIFGDLDLARAEDVDQEMILQKLQAQEHSTTMHEDMEDQISVTPQPPTTMHEDMEDQISVPQKEAEPEKKKRKRGRPRKTQASIKEAEDSEIQLNINDLDMDNISEPEER